MDCEHLLLYVSNMISWNTFSPTKSHMFSGAARGGGTIGQECKYLPSTQVQYTDQQLEGGIRIDTDIQAQGIN